ncbi:Organic hydroperoxide reductase OsmC/OhrA [Rhodococcus tukisamuensis]|uniref:Organic hydroperoxide reductase OsmC/OhrA n=1 Tax=Rhodococcus tukisamuensis TaxID=168276 RepID=A0A1G6U0W9_9NOCA|nr:Organic hydroperoxide reductase OsmC/OhrA [Rhodococcus tukisamuensis]
MPGSDRASGVVGTGSRAGRISRVREHRYDLTVTWTGNSGKGTADPRAYGRGHVVSATGKPDLPGSSDPSFRGDPSRWNPEELLVASLSQCHMLWFLGLAASAGVVVTGYVDHPTGTMTEESGGAGQFAEVTLRPEVTVSPSAGSATDVRDRLDALHQEAHQMCFIARSVNFPVRHQARVRIGA